MSLFTALESFEDGTGKPTIIGEDAEIQMTTDGDSVNSPETLDKEKLAVAKAQGDLEKENEKIAEVVEAIDALESYRQLLSKSLESGGADALTHKAIAIGVESLLSNLADVEAFSKVASMEGIDTPRGQIAATQASVEAITASMEGLLDKVKDFISKAVKGFKTLFSKLGDLLSGYEAMAKKYKQRLSSATMKTEPVGFGESGVLLVNGEVKTKYIIDSTLRFKKDMLDSGEYNKHWSSVAKLLDDKTRSPKEMDELLSNAGVKLPAYFEKGDKFGTLGTALPGDVTPYTWALSDSYGITIALKEGANKVLSPVALGYADTTPVEVTKDPVAPLTKKEAEEVCDGILEYCKAFREMQKPVFDVISSLEDVQKGLMEAGRPGITKGIPATESFIGDTIDTFKQGWNRFGDLITVLVSFWAANNLVVNGVFVTHPIAALLSNWTGIGAISSAGTVKLFSIFTGASEIIKFALIHGLFTAIGVGAIILMASLLIVAVRGAMARGDKVDPELQEDYEAYVQAYAKLTDTQKATFPDPNDLDKAIANTENKEYQQQYNNFISQFPQLVANAATQYYTDFSNFAFGAVGDVFEAAMIHVRESIEA